LQKLGGSIDQHLAVAVRNQRALKQTVQEMDAEVHRTRLVPFAQSCIGLERPIRDLARASGKQVELVISGGETEVDRSVLEALRSPLLHLVINAVDHGLESPEERRAAKKSPTGKIRVEAVLRGAQVGVTVAMTARSRS